MVKETFLTVSNVYKAFGEGDSRQEVLRGMDFTVAKGEFCVLLGPSGSGKSTLLNIIGGIDSADDSKYRYYQVLSDAQCIFKTAVTLVLAFL